MFGIGVLENVCDLASNDSLFTFVNVVVVRKPLFRMKSVIVFK